MYWIWFGLACLGIIAIYTALVIFIGAVFGLNKMPDINDVQNGENL